MIEKILRKGAVGFAESYIDGDFSTSNLKNLLIFAEKNKRNYIGNKQGGFFYKLLSHAFCEMSHGILQFVRNHANNSPVPDIHFSIFTTSPTEYCDFLGR